VSIHIEMIKKALEFNKPDYLPMEILDVPGIYNNNHTLDPSKVKLISGTENFDAIWTNCYSWFHERIGVDDNGEEIRKDQFGTILKIPKSNNYTYKVIEHPLQDKNNLNEFIFPDANRTIPEFKKLEKVINEKYKDRFINGFIDPGFFVSAQLLFGTQNFFMKIADDIKFVVEVYENLVEYYKGIVINYKNAGAHMITNIESLGSTKGLVINPDIWRKYFKPVLKDFFKFVHGLNLYTSLCVDGDSKLILEDFLELGIDLIFFVDINTTGINAIKEKLKGKICIKSTADMQSTLAIKEPFEIKKEIDEIVKNFYGKQGGFICEVLRWNRPEFPEIKVLASAEAFNKYRIF
jgi:uroporphyrinogen-III decarboxylase